MAIIANVELNTGENKNLYLRVNSVQVSNHGVKSIALIRGFLSESAFLNGKAFMYESEIEIDLDVSLPMWEQIYEEMKLIYTDSDDA